MWLNDFDSVECLNPFGTGQCLSTLLLIQLKLQYKGLNPFGTGQCLSTEDAVKGIVSLGVSIPLEQGNVFRLGGFEELNKLEGLNPFGTGQCLSTYCY